MNEYEVYMRKTFPTEKPRWIFVVGPDFGMTYEKCLKEIGEVPENMYKVVIEAENKEKCIDIITAHCD